MSERKFPHSKWVWEHLNGAKKEEFMERKDYTYIVFIWPHCTFLFFMNKMSHSFMIKYSKPPIQIAGTDLFRKFVEKHIKMI